LGTLGPLIRIFELLAPPLDHVFERTYRWIARRIYQSGIGHATAAVANRERDVRCHEMVPL